MLRPRFTLRRIMFLVAVIAVGLALTRLLSLLPGLVLVILAGLCLWVGGHCALGALNWRACWLCSVRPRYAWKILVATAVLLIGWMSLLGIFWVYHGYNVEHLLLTVMVLLPFVLGAGIWVYHDWNRPNNLHSTADRVVLYLLVALATTAVVGNWPFHLAFALSRPALDRIADQVESGSMRPPALVRAGFFQVDSPRLDKETGRIVVLPLTDHGGSLLSFAAYPNFCRSMVPLAKTTGPLGCTPSDKLLGDRWYYKYWGQFAD